MTEYTRHALGVVATLMPYRARRYFRNWGTTKDESSVQLPGDELITQPATHATEGLWIDPPDTHGWQDRCRLLIRTRVTPRHPGDIGMLRGIKKRAEEARAHLGDRARPAIAGLI